MHPIKLTHRTITHRWNKETQVDDEVVTDEAVYFNPELIEFIEPINDAPRTYSTCIRMQSGQNEFVVESPEDIADAIKAARYCVYLEQALGKTS